MKTKNTNNIKLALQKNGRMTEESLSILRAVGLDCNSGGRKLISRCSNFPLELLFLRSQDIPEYVQDSVADLGIVGENVLLEKSYKVKVLERLGFGRCSLKIAIPNNSKIKELRELKGKKIATSYPNSLRLFLKKKKVKAEIIEISGSVEITPSLGVADAICDLVSTGSTLKSNNLEEICTVYDSEIVLIANPSVLKDQKKKISIDRLLMRIQSYLLARKTKYIMMNAPEIALPKIQKILPGLESPTIMPLAKKGMIAIHTVVPEETFWETIEQLKGVGATGILVTGIEKIVV